MSRPPKTLSPDEHGQLVGYLEFHCPTHPQVYSECAALARSFGKRIDEWQERDIVLPRPAELEQSAYPSGEVYYTVQWPGLALRRPPISFRDPATAATVVWTVYMLHRPWGIDDARLSALVDDPPISHARLVGSLVGLRLSAQVFLTASRMLALWAQRAQRGIKMVEDGEPDPLKALMQGSLDRLTLAIRYVSDLLGVEEVKASLGQEIYRWRWMLLDYLEKFSPPLGDRIEALARRYARTSQAAQSEDDDRIWDNIDECRRLEACTGVLLARASMLDPKSMRTHLVDFVDPLATRAMGSLAWWCRLMQETREEPDLIAERLPPEGIEACVETARCELERIDAPLLQSLLETFPSLEP